MKESGWSLLEAMVVLIIIGILATLGLAQYGTYKESSLDKEAKANLRLIVAAERIYRMEVGVYYPCGDSGCLNNNLKLFLPSANWSYSSTGGGATCAQATRNGGDGRSWSYRSNQAPPDEPVTGGCS
jgi:type II secretory pathway pseudopilin PulG